MSRIHATCVALGGNGALIRGASGAGKSSLALRFLALPASVLTRGCSPELIADDQVLLEMRQGRDGDAFVEARAPALLRDRMEVRGIGIVDIPAKPSARVVALIELARVAAIDRLPDPAPQETLLGLSLPLYRLDPEEAAAPMRLAIAIWTAPGWTAPA